MAGDTYVHLFRRMPRLALFLMWKMNNLPLLPCSCVCGHFDRLEDCLCREGSNFGGSMPVISGRV